MMRRKESGMTETNDVLTIDVVSDVVCPWCYLGEKRLAAALAEESRQVAVRWRPYQLDPTIPEGGLDGAGVHGKEIRSGRTAEIDPRPSRAARRRGRRFVRLRHARRIPSTRIG